jgi:hypothetical protein
MMNQAVCAGLSTGSPQVSVSALNDIHHLIRALKADTPSEVKDACSSNALAAPVQLMSIQPADIVRPVILSPDQNRKLESALAQLLLSALQPSPQSMNKGGEDVVEDHA